MKTYRTVIFLALAGVLLSAVSLPASTEEEVYRPVGTRMAAQFEKAESQQERALFSEIYPDAITEEEERKYFEEAQQLSPEDIQAKGAKATQALVKSSLSNTSHFGAYHSSRLISSFGDEIILEDGSKWTVKKCDQGKTLQWYTTDRLVITPNHDWFSSYDYRINNLTTGQMVYVNLMEAPCYNGIYTHWIVAIDYVHHKVCLEDGSIWTVSMWDGAELKRMALEDTVIIGTNDSWFRSSRPNILINADTMEYVKARCDY